MSTVNHRYHLFLCLATNFRRIVKQFSRFCKNFPRSVFVWNKLTPRDYPIPCVGEHDHQWFCYAAVVTAATQPSLTYFEQISYSFATFAIVKLFVDFEFLSILTKSGTNESRDDYGAIVPHSITGTPRQLISRIAGTVNRQDRFAQRRPPPL